MFMSEINTAVLNVQIAQRALNPEIGYKMILCMKFIRGLVYDCNIGLV